MPNILVIDQGTTSSRAIIFDQQANIVEIAQTEYPQRFPKDGWVEHCPEDIWETVLATSIEVLKKSNLSASDICSIGITNQRETSIIWDRKTGLPIYNAIVWQDRRTSQYCKELIEQGHEPLITDKTGLLIDPYFSATKIYWMLQNIPDAYQRAQRGELAFGTIDTFILWRLTNGQSHKTDATNASRTMLFNIHTQQWDKELLDLFDIPLSLMPQVLDCASDFGLTNEKLLGGAIPIQGMIGDQQAALFGQCCFEPGMAKSTFGTGGFVMLNTGKTVSISQHRLLSTVAYRLDGQVTYAVEGSIFIAGAVINWLRDGLKLIDNAKQTQSIAQKTPLDHGVYFVPAFTGLGAPYWEPDVRGGIFGLTRDTGINEIVTAALQSICYQCRDIQQAMVSDGMTINSLRVDGAMAGNVWFLQFLSDMLNAQVERPVVIESTALGAAYMAGLKAGVFNNLEQLSTLSHIDRKFSPVIDNDLRQALYVGWLKAVSNIIRK